MRQVITMNNAGHPSQRNHAGPALGPGVNGGYGDELFSAVFDSSAEALVIIDTAGAIQRANPHARELLHLKAPTRRSLDLGDFLAAPAADQLASLWMPGQRPARPQSFEASLATGFPIRITLRWILPGTQHLLLCIEDGPVVQRAEAKSRYLEAELRSLLESVPVGVLLIDPSGGIRFSNARFGQLFGLSTREVETTASVDALEELLAERFRNPADFATPWRAYASGSGEPQHDELELMRPARRVFERFSRPVLDAEGHHLGWLELYTDVTGERQIQSKMLQTEKMAALGQLVSGIAHELNNPLTAIMGYAQLMLGHGLNPGQFSEAKKVYQEAERARRIVKNLLYFARETAPERTQVDVNEIVERTLALRSYELKTENIVVTCELAPGLPQTIADAYQLQQVVLNLLINAEQALLEGRGQGRVLIRTSHIIEGLGSHGVDRIVLEVSDDGPGVSPEIASRIFDPFFTTKQPGLGTGLGLSIVYGIVHQHHGEVTFENQPGGGAHFVVELPIVAVPASSPAPVLLEPAGRNGASPTGRILVVEDEPTVAQLVVDVLREEGHRAEAVLDSQEGLTRVSRGAYDLVICDLRMPRLDGAGFYDALVRTGSPIRNRIIFITGDTLSPRTHDFLDRNKLPYLAKPFLVEEIKLAVSRALTAVAKQGT
jgi:PAS domain S-box-containing protein